MGAKVIESDPDNRLRPSFAPARVQVLREPRYPAHR